MGTLIRGDKVLLKSGNLPVIGENGNWYIDGVDSGKPSKGEDANVPSYTVFYKYNVGLTNKSTKFKEEFSYEKL